MPLESISEEELTIDCEGFPQLQSDLPTLQCFPSIASLDCICNLGGTRCDDGLSCVLTTVRIRSAAPTRPGGDRWSALQQPLCRPALRGRYPAIYEGADRDYYESAFQRMGRRLPERDLRRHAPRSPLPQGRDRPDRRRVLAPQGVDGAQRSPAYSPATQPHLTRARRPGATPTPALHAGVSRRRCSPALRIGAGHRRWTPALRDGS